MKTRAVVVVLLAAAFLWLATLTEALPATAREAAWSDEPEPAARVLAAQPPSPTARPSPAPTAEPSPEPSPEPTPEPTAEPTPSPEPVPESAVAVVATTITSAAPVKNGTSLSVDPEALAAEALALTLPAEGPQILIVHTHGTEAYSMAPGAVYEPAGDYRTTDSRCNVLRVGEELKEALEAYGLSVLHDTGLYDYPSYNGSYSRCGEAVAAYLAEYPSIAVVIDVHRDALGTEEKIYKTVTASDTESAAQLMLVMGTDEKLEHPLWRENLKLALRLQAAAEARCATLMRPIDLCGYRYNQQLTTGSMILEVGSCGNTLDEALAAARLFAEAAGPVLAALAE